MVATPNTKALDLFIARIWNLNLHEMTLYLIGATLITKLVGAFFPL
jgi:hypothetical protein